MSRGLDENVLLTNWSLLPKDWYSIYQWSQTKVPTYTAWVANQIHSSFADIQLVTHGLRSRSFRCLDHRGQAKLQTDISQLTEKRLVRAMFNAGKIPLLGDVLDYEVPLKETDDAPHGDIDLVCRQPDVGFCVEAKKPGSTESILKGILQAFVYTSLVSTRRDGFLRDFGFTPTTKLTPAVLTFASARSGEQLKEPEEHPALLRLVEILNAKLKVGGINPLRFFVVENDDAELATCLTTLDEPNGDVKVVFCKDFELKISEYPMQLDNPVDATVVGN